ncbi:LytR/AlgR family response regulator transcription factor [Maribacter polysaccharolyticus]|uniref:LytR/AlgR family response regulator transcription factor n=1 Tax=Maribacter polysaccharolyticus TaxID=3020831 RepID=UPI00237F1D67|nr:LytTR family DNA-binding domain-containing protein [Maribacter polysaccharolyticus]MDE3742027.1 LytTR family DNA-binding domain-containing protein [Maribacter polysaccharolyticus]
MIRCIAIDDEPLALKQIANYIEKTPFLSLENQFESAIQAISFLEENEVDLMFVDINMPDLNGLDFVKSLSNAPKVIFTTAYSEYAIEGFRVDAIDYLLKPIGYSEFLKAAVKAKERLQPKIEENTEVHGNDKFLFIKSEYKILRINLSDIRFIEGMREYLRIHLQSEKPIMTLMSMKKMEQFLSPDHFMRVHRSYIVNLDKISTVERNRIVFDKNIYIPISEQYKLKFQKYLDDNFLV